MSKRPKANLSQISFYLNKGYSLREIFFRGMSLKLFSLIFSYIKFPLAARGSNLQIDSEAMIDGCRHISLGHNVWLQKHSWLAVPLVDIPTPENRIYLKIGDGCRIGPRSTISAANYIEIGSNVLLAPNVMIIDHGHGYTDVTEPILDQGLSPIGSIKVEENCWLGTNSVIYANRPMTIGRNSVISANSIVTSDVPPYSVVAGCPAKVIKKFDKFTNTWIKI